MKFLHLIGSVRRESGGPAESLRSIVDGYLRSGHTAEIVSLDPPGEEGTYMPVPVHPLGNKLYGYGRTPHLRPWLRENASRFDGAVVEGLWRYQGAAVLTELPGRLPYVVFTHGMLDPWFNKAYPLKKWKKLPYWLAVERRLLAHAYRVLFTCKVEAELAPTSFPLSLWRSEIVPFGTAGPPGDAEAERAAFAERVPEARGPFLLFAGRLHEKKGCDLLLRAYAAVQRERELPHLLMAGPDSVGLTLKLKEIAKAERIIDRVIWPGMIEGAAKWGAFRSAEAFVLPSHQENFGIAVAEALSCGTPVLISNQVNIHEDVSDFRAGYIEPDTLEGTIALLRRWAATPAEERDAMRVRSRQCWVERFDSEGTSRALVSIFQRAAAEANRV